LKKFDFELGSTLAEVGNSFNLSYVVLEYNDDEDAALIKLLFFFNKNNILTMNEQDLIGLTLEEVYMQYPDLHTRVMREDENHYMGTADLRMDRYNLQLDNGIVTSVSRG
jgi:hypothetical protein